ncbi:MAG: Uncharacterised protein [Formosa sp. Hel1_33_131]|nr:MAG: Uncharacterised protein [Formosa sp. Hel1_33_131]|tara:strand:- start:1301 stop:1750 length:450 start_codon:yes stop_codon:yes gene_type:complete
MKTILLILSFFLSFGCNNNDSQKPFQSTEITFTEIGQGALFGNGVENISQSNLLINNQTDWQNLISQMNSVNNVSDTFFETSIDFDNFSVIAIFLEIKGNGWEVVINTIIENEDYITISIQETEFMTTVITQPFQIVKIPKTTKEIVTE